LPEFPEHKLSEIVNQLLQWYADAQSNPPVGEAAEVQEAAILLGKINFLLVDSETERNEFVPAAEPESPPFVCPKGCRPFVGLLVLTLMLGFASGGMVLVTYGYSGEGIGFYFGAGVLFVCCIIVFVVYVCFVPREYLWDNGPANQ
jgi:hypothetical protein